MNPPLLAGLLFLVVLRAAPAGTRLKDLISIEGVRDNQLVGYGLVVGLNGTGDKIQTVFSTQSLTNLLARMGVQINPTADTGQKYRGGAGDREPAAICSARHANRYNSRGDRRCLEPTRGNSGSDTAQRPRTARSMPPLKDR